MISICKSIKDKFKDWNKKTEQIYQWMILDCHSISRIWNDILPIDTQCRRYNNLSYSLHRNHSCQNCRNIDHLSTLGIILQPNQSFQVDCSALPIKTYILKSYQNMSPYLQMNEKYGKCIIITDVVTKQFLINVWTSYTIDTMNVVRDYTLQQCGTTMTMLQDGDTTSISSTMSDTEIEATWRQLLKICSGLIGLFHGNPVVSSLRLRNNKWKGHGKTYPVTICLDDFRRSRLFTREFQISSHGQLPIIGHDYLTIYEDGKEKWIELDRELLTNMLKEMIEYIPTLDFYCFIISLCCYVNKFIYSDWLNQLFKSEQINIIKDRIFENSGKMIYIDDLIDILDGMWIKTDFGTIHF